MSSAGVKLLKSESFPFLPFSCASLASLASLSFPSHSLSLSLSRLSAFHLSRLASRLPLSFSLSRSLSRLSPLFLRSLISSFQLLQRRPRTLARSHDLPHAQAAYAAARALLQWPRRPRLFYPLRACQWWHCRYPSTCPLLVGGMVVVWLLCCSNCLVLFGGIDGCSGGGDDESGIGAVITHALQFESRGPSA